MKAALPLPAELDQRIAAAIRARGPVTKYLQVRDEFKAAQPWLNVLYVVALVVVFLLPKVLHAFP